MLGWIIAGGIGVLAVALVLGRSRKASQPTRPGREGTPSQGSAIELVERFANRPNTPEVLEEKGREYGRLLMRWALDDAAAFLQIAKEHGLTVKDEVEAQAYVLVSSHAIVADYAATALVKAQGVFKDGRIPPWADALAATIATMTIEVAPDGTVTSPSENLFHEYLAQDYKRDKTEAEKFNSLLGARLCKRLNIANAALALDPRTMGLFIARFSDSHYAFLLAAPEELPHVAQLVAEHNRLAAGKIEHEQQTQR